MLATHAGALMPHIPPVPDLSVLLLMHFDGPSESNQFDDSSLYVRTLTPVGNPFLIDTPTLYGPTVGSFDGNSRVQAANSADFDFGTENFTVETYVWVDPSNGVSMVIGTVDLTGIPSAGWYMLMSGDTPNFYFYQVGNDLVTCPGQALSRSAWHHVACVRDGAFMRMYIDGGFVGGTEIVGEQSMQSSPDVLRVGDDSEGVFGGFVGFLSELRVIRGLTLYSGSTGGVNGSFTPPTPPLPNP